MFYTAFENKIARAIWLANVGHEGQTYGPNLPMISHVAEVAICVQHYTYDNDVIAAAWLHDVVEDTANTLDDLREYGFSPATCDIVDHVTDPPGKNRKEKKAAMYAKVRGYKGQNLNSIQLVKMCDRLCNHRMSLREKNVGKAQMYIKEWNEFHSVFVPPGESDYGQLIIDLYGTMYALEQMVHNA